MLFELTYYSTARDSSVIPFNMASQRIALPLSRLHRAAQAPRTLATTYFTALSRPSLRTQRLLTAQRSSERRIACFHTSSRHLSAPSSSTEPAPLTPEQYHKIADAYIETLLVDFEELQEDDEEVDVEYSAGVLNLKIPGKGTYVINKQPPNKQIWLSSPESGPKRFDYVLGGITSEEAEKDAESTERVEGGEWVYLRDGTSLSELLRQEVGVELRGLEED